MGPTDLSSESPKLPRGVWVWFAGIATMPIVLGAFTPKIGDVCNALGVELLVVAATGAKLAYCISSPVGIITVVVLAVLLAVPALVWRSPQLNRMYWIAGIVATLVVGTLSLSVYSVIDNLSAQLGSQAVPQGR